MNIFQQASFILLVVMATEANLLSKLHRFRRQIVPRIVGGRPVKQNEAPFQLSLQHMGQHHCGASIVEVHGLQIALTAAHCIFTDQLQFYEVIAGDNNLKDKSGWEQVRQVDRVFLHQNFSRTTFENDVAIILLNSSFQLNKNVQTVPLPKQGQETLEGNLTVSGWGLLSTNGMSPDDLYIVQIPIVNDTQCQAAYQNLTEIHKSMICAGSAEEMVDACIGDSGGPALSVSGYLAGIVSFGVAMCAHPHFPGVYTEVSHFVDWIEGTIQNAFSTLQLKQN